MRALSAILLLFSTLLASGQSDPSGGPYRPDRSTPSAQSSLSSQSPRGGNWHAGLGLAFGTLNFNQNGHGAIAVPVRYDFLNIGSSSFSMGTNIKIGTEDEYGVSFPVLLLLFGVASAVGANGAAIFPDANNNNGSGYGIGLFLDLPLLLHYNVGLGTKEGENNPIGYYVGGGMSYTLTGYTPRESVQQSTHFFGWVGNAGVRFRNGIDLGLSVTLPRDNPIGPINHPILYQLTFCSFRRTTSAKPSRRS